MSGDRLELILDATYGCFTRHGVRRTTMDDIATAAGISRPAVYQYVRNKDDAFRRLAARLFTTTLARARLAAGTDEPLADRLALILEAKLELTLRLWRDSPHAAELLGGNARVSADLDAAFMAHMRDLLTGVIGVAAVRGEIAPPEGGPAELAELALALTRGIEAGLADPDLSRRRLRRGVALLVAGHGSGTW
jgi:TetR/AcrR family transcriptional regulator